MQESCQAQTQKAKIRNDGFLLFFIFLPEFMI